MAIFTTEITLHMLIGKDTNYDVIAKRTYGPPTSCPEEMTQKEQIMNIIASWLSCLVNRTSKSCKEPSLHPLLLVPRALIWSGFILIVRITVKITVRMEKSQSS